MFAAVIVTSVVLNAVMAWVAGMSHMYAASVVEGKLRWTFLSIGTLAFFYSLAYWWLLVNPDNVEQWSDFLRPFGIITWVLAWTVEPFVLVHYLKGHASDIEARAARLVEKVARETAERRLRDLNAEHDVDL